MLDNFNLLVQRDPQNALGVAGDEWKQLKFEAEVLDSEHDGREIHNIVIAGMGGSALAALIAKKWLENEISQPFEIIRDYHLPNYISQNTLVIASSYSGNTEETLAALEQAQNIGAQIATISSHGKLENIAKSHQIAHVKLPEGLQPRMAVFYNLRALVKILVNFNLVSEEKYQEIARSADFLRHETEQWLPSVPAEQNLAKQIALYSAGRSAVFLSASEFSPVAYKWKISWNENAKNVSFWNEYPEFNHNEFLGWSAQPVEKLFAIFNLRSSFENPQIAKRFRISDALLEGKRPTAREIELQGATPLEQMLWGSILADFASIYLAILNNENPTPVELIEKLKVELVK
ncbi:MAG: bifunctional phosphoglucose/phosphomannose isomerase [bacterium]|nr:bifunctional phosphoglucose/phosphomannose isomerase [bacterium]